jgi:hypothetical protein
MPQAGPQPKLMDAAKAEGTPWTQLVPVEPSIGYVSYYYADELARLPVRAITRIKDNKSDPNLETGTYGLFSTCQEKMRSGIVRHRPRYIFFITKPRNGGRQLSGMYELGWWAPGSLSSRIRDFSLAARSLRFVTPEPVDQLPGELAKLLSGRWRLVKRLGPEHTAQLAAHLQAKRDRTAEYLLEVDRMERINNFHSGYRYPTWRRSDSWRWGDAGRYLNTGPVVAGEPLKILNSSPSGWWRCAECGGEIENRALLKACPSCQEIGTLRPLDLAPVAEEAA